MLRARDLVFGLALGLLASVVYVVGFQHWVYGDGPQLIDTFLFLDRLWPHVLYIPTARLLAAGMGALDPIDPLRAVSIVGGGAGVAGTYLLSRWFGANHWRAAFAASLAGATPAIAFLSTTIEVHALHFGAVSLSAYALLRAPWKRFAPSVLLTVALVPVLYLTHKSGALLAPGWLALALHARERATGAPADRRVFLVLAATIGSAFLASILLGGWLVPSKNTIGGTLSFIHHFQQGVSLGFFREAILIGLGVLVPMAVVGILWAPKRERLLFGALVLPVLLFFTWYGEATRGGYFVSIVPFLAVLAGRSLPGTRAAVPIAVMALAGQGFLSWFQIDAYGERFSEMEQVARVAAVHAVLADSGVLVSFEPTLQPVTLALPGVREINVRADFMKTTMQGMDPKTSALDPGLYLQKVQRQSEGRVVLDLGLARRASSRSELGVYLDEIEAAVSSAFDGVVHEDPRFPMIVIR